jgi:hypothetical protein
MLSGTHASHGPSLREKVIDISRCLRKCALSLQVRNSRGNSIVPGIENRDLITLVALVVKDKFVAMVAMCAFCHNLFYGRRFSSHFFIIE